VEAVLADVCRSTTEKSDEITQLRADVLGLYRDQLMERAKAMARSFVAGGRLFTFGNGGSSTDAQASPSFSRTPVRLPAHCLRRR
jgi:D-sedoheptulose 7-phosphate isomerase